MSRRGPGEPRSAPDRTAAVEIALHFLGTRPRSRWEVRRRLQRAAADHEVIEATLERLTELGYLDDTAFARWWADQRDRHAPRGRRLVEAELRQRGVPREVIEQLQVEPGAPADGESLPEDDEERARLALERHLRGRPLPSEAKALQRLGMFLMRRGFDAETVRTVLRSAQGDSETQEA